MSTIQLHPTKGVNPKLTFCPSCGQDANELVLVGKQDYKWTCNHCSQMHIGYFPKCQKCGSCDRGSRIEITEHERLPASQPCDECQEFNKVANEAFKSGGIIIRCKVCGGQAVIKGTTDMAIRTREHSGIFAPNPVGLELDSCEQHPVFG